MRYAARHGDAKAQYNLGILYDEGIGVAKNRRWAALWMQKAAAQGHPGALEFLAPL